MHDWCQWQFGIFKKQRAMMGSFYKWHPWKIGGDRLDYHKSNSIIREAKIWSSLIFLDHLELVWQPLLLLYRSSSNDKMLGFFWRVKGIKLCTLGVEKNWSYLIKKASPHKLPRWSISICCYIHLGCAVGDHMFCKLWQVGWDVVVVSFCWCQMEMLLVPNHLEYDADVFVLRLLI
jgi:hypothetical protein